MYSALKVDSNDIIHIFSFDNTNKTLKYSTNLSGNFITYTISDNFASVGLYPTIEIDNNNLIHISHDSDDDGTLLFTTLDPYAEL